MMQCHATIATEDEARPYAQLIDKLMGDEAYYCEASAAARASGLAFIRQHRGSFGDVLEELAAAWSAPQKLPDFLEGIL